MNILRTKSVEQSIKDTEDGEHKLKRDLRAIDLLVFGIGMIIGTGIFVLTGIAAATKAGPAIVLSFVVSGITCAFAALCYAEFASAVPVAGSTYTFAYASLGEVVAWVIGWDLLLEVIVGASAVSVSWAKYFNTILHYMGIQLPASITGSQTIIAGLHINLLATFIALLLTVIVTIGIRESARFNLAVTSIKLAVVLFFIIFGIFFIKTANWIPFIPPSGPAPHPVNAGASAGFLDQPLIGLVLGQQSAFGFQGIITGAAVVFFAYIGFEIVSTTAEETRNPQRDMPIGILGSLFVCTVLYIAVSFVLTGMVSYKQLNTEAPMATAFTLVGQGWAAVFVSIGAVCGLTSVIMVQLLGASRVLFAMSRDHLLSVWFARTHPRFRTPYRINIIIGCLVAIIATITPIQELADLVNYGTLLAFVLVSIAVIVLRKTNPNLPRSFRVPWVPLVPILSALCCLYLMISLPIVTWIRFIVWLAIGFVVYFLYSMRHSRVSAQADASETVTTKTS
ncbi:amino acid permease [Dictyobacter formicarum]|uniref:Amino acid permease n=1 Tax=Dictyobacter formicarum TaxID=2778368 RepID=A0ABQ3VQ33_9CHLR|nr:amino acid permease [Dictyobacter formicarum]GHO87491.1 amino acid permease [Dictyobacter formicarum]